MIVKDKTCQLFEYGSENEDRQDDSYLSGCIDEFFANESEISRPLIFNHDSDKIVGAAKARKSETGLEVFDIDIYDSCEKKELYLEAIAKGEMYMSYQFYWEGTAKTSGGDNIVKITDILEFTLTPVPVNPISKIKSLDGKESKVGTTKNFITIKSKSKMNKKFKALKKKALDAASLTDAELSAFIMALEAVEQTEDVTALLSALNTEKESRAASKADKTPEELAEEEAAKKSASSEDPAEKGLTEKSIKKLVQKAIQTNNLKSKAVVNITEPNANEGFAQAVKDFKADKGVIKLKGVTGTAFFERAEKRKAVGTMVTANANTPFAFNSDFLGTFTPNAPTPLTNYLSSSSTSTNFLEFMDFAKKDGTPIMVGEGVNATDVDYNLVLKSLPLQRLPIKTVLAKSIFNSQNEVQNGVKKMMDIDLINAMNAQIVAGTGVAPQVKGLATYSQTIITTPFSAKVSGANEGDVLVIAVMQQIGMLFQPSVVLVHPTDYTKILLLKDTTLNSVNSKAITFENGKLAVLGVPIEVNLGLIAGSFYSVAGGDIEFKYNSNTGTSAAVITNDTQNVVAGTATFVLDLNFNLAQPDSKIGAVVGGNFAGIIAVILKP